MPMALRVLRISSVLEAPQATLDHPVGRVCDPVGGMQTHVAELTRSLDELGLCQTLLTARRPGAPAHERLGRRASVHRVGLRTHRLRQLYSIPAAPLALELARQADLVHAHLGEDVAVLPIASLAAKAQQVPLVVTIHTSVRHTLRAVDLRTAVVRSVGGPIEARVLRRADAVIALTQRRAQLAAADGVPPERITVVPSGVATRLLRPAAAQLPPDPFPMLGRPRVLFLGRLVRQKGVHTLVSAAARLPRAAEVLFVGDGPARNALEQQAARLGVRPRVHFAGFVAREHVPAVLAHADVLALPSVYEELGSVMLEAMWMGLPVVGSDTGGIPEVVRDGHNGYVVPVADPDALAERLTHLLCDDALRATLSVGARATGTRFEWEMLAPRVAAVYAKVAESRSTRMSLSLRVQPVTRRATQTQRFSV
jgi:glycosyltransferase involved in cell wall biosynthesis